MMQAEALRSTARRASKTPPARSVTALYRDFEAVHAQLKSAQKELEGTDLNATTPENTRVERLIRKCHRAAAKVMEAPAASIPEILFKLRALAWGHLDAEHELEDLDHHMPIVEETQASHALASVQADLLRITAG